MKDNDGENLLIHVNTDKLYPINKEKFVRKEIEYGLQFSIPENIPKEITEELRKDKKELNWKNLLEKLSCYQIWENLLKHLENLSVENRNKVNRIIDVNLSIHDICKKINLLKSIRIDNDFIKAINNITDIHPLFEHIIFKNLSIAIECMGYT